MTLSTQEFEDCQEQAQIIIEALNKINDIAQDPRVTRAITSGFGHAFRGMFSPIIDLWVEGALPEADKEPFPKE